MQQILFIYITGLLVCTLWPAKVSSVPFINISDSLNFEIDVDSPVLAAEKDLVSYLDVKPSSHKAQYSNLNESVIQKAPLQQIRLVDYSRDILDIHNNNGLTLVGPLELKQGLALTDETRLEIHREEKGQVVEYGDIDIEKGTYAIKLSSLDGHLCAKLRGARHEILGQGCFSLEQVRQQKKSSRSGPLLSLSKYQDIMAISQSQTNEDVQALSLPKLDNTPLQKVAGTKVRGSTYNTNYQIYDYYDSSSSEPKALSDVTIDNSVAGHEDSSSTIVTTVTSPGYMPVRVVSNGATPRRGVAMQRRGTHIAAHNLAKDAGYVAGDPFSSGTVWGRAMKDGKSIAGADVVIEGRNDLRPLYLNEFYIPDPNQKVTASHGLYTFVGVPDGEYAIRAQQGSNFVGFQNASVRTGAIAIADIDSSIRKKEVRLSVYDIVNKTSQAAVVTLQNFEEDVVVESGVTDLLVQDTTDLAFAIVNPLGKNYLSAQYALQPNEDLYNFPLISQKWLESVLAQARLNQAIKSKIVLGIGALEPFKVEAVGSKAARVIYFDSQGLVTEGNFGSVGGGFIILDPEDGVVEYAIQSAGQKELQVHYMPAQVGVLSVIQMYQ